MVASAVVREVLKGSPPVGAEVERMSMAAGQSEGVSEPTSSGSSSACRSKSGSWLGSAMADEAAS